jgi:chemotaxis regulatin CheY-phosphate phosphatase CheZ
LTAAGSARDVAIDRDGTIDEESYRALEAALMAGGRGRAFLAEHARRARAEDTATVLGAINRLEGVIREQDHASDVERFRGDVVEMARRLADTRRQIAAITAEGLPETHLGRAKGELESIVQATESATQRILESAEQIQEIAWTLREAGLAIETCDAIDERATEIYLACSFQDLTAQRSRKVIEAMRFLEERIDRMLEIWGFSIEATIPPDERQRIEESLQAIGPPNERLQQVDIDHALAGAKRAAAIPPITFGLDDAPAAEPDSGDAALPEAAAADRAPAADEAREDPVGGQLAEIERRLAALDGGRTDETIARFE